MDKDTKKIGNITELEVLTYITKLGHQVSIPFGDRARYDQIWDIDGRLIKVQVKTAHLINDGTAIEISCKSSNRCAGKNINRRYTPEEIDFIASYFDGKCYLIPIKETSSRSKKLRFQHPKNNQLLNINWAVDYEVENILKRI
jgi:hypothetical protein